MQYFSVPVLGRLPKIALGCDRFGDEVDEKTALSEIECYLENGGFVLDSAHAYGQKKDGEPSSSECLIGRFLKSVDRDKVFVSTKGGLSREKVSRLDYQSLKSDIEMSVESLQTVPDLWFFHRDNPSLSVEALMDTVFEFRKKGYLKHLGASNWSTSRIEEANRYAESKVEEGFVAAENQFSLAYTNREIWGESDMEYVGSPRSPKAWFQENKFPCFCYSSQGRGILQKINRGATEFGKASRFYSKENIERAERLRRVATETGLRENDII
ncbi:MAG: aldo/keto reductase, partial [Spirochaetales bacterium]|nr:aldo/keto reductase [Candidatus Physcosoma equi]